MNDLTPETQRQWDEKAAFWNDLMGSEGNRFHRTLVSPAAEHLLNVQAGETILDVACGNGTFPRRLAVLGAQVIATDFSTELLEHARRYTDSPSIEYRQVDATDTTQLLALGEKRFDAAVCNMALMDMTTIEPLIQTLPRLLKPGGRFVFTIPHPCFNSTDTRMMLEQEDRDGILITRQSIKVTNYLHLPPQKGLGAVGEPAPHYYFHRPLYVILNTCFQAGFVMDGIEEPAFTEDGDQKQALSWINYKNISPLLAARMRVIQFLG
jgi:SAM-dependent methyltransferase